MQNGQFQLYTGNGKGKTTAAVGLAVRAHGTRLRVWFGQFLKQDSGSEIAPLRALGIPVECFGSGAWVQSSPSAEETARAETGLQRLEAALSGGAYDVVIADEALIACSLGLFTPARLLRCIACRPPEVEFIATGRDAPPEITAAANLVTEMRETKHYYRDTGLQARRGIEY